VSLFFVFNGRLYFGVLKVMGSSSKITDTGVWYTHNTIPSVNMIHGSIPKEQLKPNLFNFLAPFALE
jgi:hypothetical protein